MSTDDSGETVTRSELTALIDAAVARALSSRPCELEGNSGHLFCFSFCLSTSYVRGLEEGMCIIDKRMHGVGTGGRIGHNRRGQG